MTITTTELLDALAESVAKHDRDPDIPPDVFSAAEIREAKGWGHSTFLRTMRGMLADGTAEVVRIRKRAIDGRLSNVSAYRICVAPKRGKRAA